MNRNLIIGLCLTCLLCSTAYAFPGALGQPQMQAPGQEQSCGEMPPRPQDAERRPAPLIKLSEEQKQQVEVIQTQEAVAAKQLFTKMQNARKTVMDLEMAGKFDEEVFRKAARDVADIDMELMVLRAKTDFAVKALLTEEQKNQMIMMGIHHLASPQMPLARPGMGQPDGKKMPRPMPQG